MTKTTIVYGELKELDELLDEAEKALGSIVVEKAKEKSIAFYGRQVRGFTRALWAGTIDVLAFSNNMMQAISRNFEMAWREGSAVCGISPEDRTIEEEIRLRQERDTDVAHVMSFADFIEQNNKASGQKLRRSLNRAKLWTNRYNAIVSIAKLIACADKKFKWVRGPTEKPCPDCLGYDGRVHRGSVWRSVGAQTQSRALACTGRNCLCQLISTNDRATPGRPRRPGG